jgi:hypothetical protein
MQDAWAAGGPNWASIRFSAKARMKRTANVMVSFSMIVDLFLAAPMVFGLRVSLVGLTDSKLAAQTDTGNLLENKTFIIFYYSHQCRFVVLW